MTLIVLLLAVLSLLLHSYFAIVFYWSGNFPLITTILLFVGIGYTLFLCGVWLKKRSTWTYFHFPLVFLIPVFIGHQQEKKFKAYASQQLQEQILRNKKMVEEADAVFRCNESRIAIFFASGSKSSAKEKSLEPGHASKKGDRILLLPETFDALPETLCLWQESQKRSICNGYERQKKETNLDCQHPELGSLEKLLSTRF